MPNALIDQIHGIDPALLAILHSHELHSARDVLFSSIIDLIDVLGISHTQAEQLQRIVSAHTCPAFTTVGASINERPISMKGVLHKPVY